MLSPKIQLFNVVFQISTDLGYQTIDYAPVSSPGLTYPFVHVGESNSTDVINNKGIITGRISQTIHVWGYANDRALFSGMMDQLETSLRKLTRLKNYYIKLEELQSNEIYDNTTNDNLLHGIIQVEYKLT
ncbi:hypothetical protein [Pontibacillus litoralis]|uniref:Uncharacterized protein n=1 Tax=Pontibacillus litoralis JSM 072002 TaxID=1385512 RepID=A0A0A5G4K5_9BACI|nr:hypothetical protein [Pontibacillus litoralis]KGX88036.1 hypothetical protein N784_13015 [Pontibacillus litoralis JSM 072002]